MPVILLFSFWIAFIVGWLANIYQVATALMANTWAEITPFIVFKLVSIFLAPIGSILGWVGMF